MISPNFSQRRRSSWSRICVGAFAATSLVVGGSAWAQGFRTTFDEGTGTYPQPAGSLSGQNGWDTNDAAKTGAASYVGQSDYVGQITGYTGSSTTNYQGAVGGLFHGTGANQDLPGSTVVYVEHPFNLAGTTGYVFTTDFNISFTSGVRDSFGFNFGSGFATATPSTLFSINFTPDLSGAGNSATQMIIGYTANGTTVTPTPPSASSVFYNGIYRLRIAVNVTARTFTATISSTQGTPNTYTIGPISTGTDPSLVTQFAARWTLNNPGTPDGNGGYTNAGTNALEFDNIVIAVPEPSTWAMLAAGVLCLAVVARRRVRA